MQKFNIIQTSYQNLTDIQKKRLETFKNKLDDSQYKLNNISFKMLKSNKNEKYNFNDIIYFICIDISSFPNYPIGFCIVIPNHIPKIFDIIQLYIDEDYRNKSAAKQLLEYIFNDLKTKYDGELVGINCINENNIANKLFNSLGMQPISIYYKKEL